MTKFNLAIFFSIYSPSLKGEIDENQTCFRACPELASGVKTKLIFLQISDISKYCRVLN
jgi:hypothetical protein